MFRALVTKFRPGANGPSRFWWIEDHVGPRPIPVLRIPQRVRPVQRDHIRGSMPLPSDFDFSGAACRGRLPCRATVWNGGRLIEVDSRHDHARDPEEQDVRPVTSTSPDRTARRPACRQASRRVDSGQSQDENHVSRHVVVLRIGPAHVGQPAGSRAAPPPTTRIRNTHRDPMPTNNGGDVLPVADVSSSSCTLPPTAPGRIRTAPDRTASSCRRGQRRHPHEPCRRGGFVGGVEPVQCRTAVPCSPPATSGTARSPAISTMRFLASKRSSPASAGGTLRAAAGALPRSGCRFMMSGIGRP